SPLPLHDALPIYPCNLAAAEIRAELLLDRHDVRKHLTGVQKVRQPVDDRNARVMSQLDHVAVVEGADHDPVDVTREDARGVLDRLPASELDVAGRQEERVPAELEGPDLERDSRPGRALLEDHRQRLARKR